MAVKVDRKRFLRFNILAALFLIAVGLLVNVWSVGYLFAPLIKNGKMVFETRVLIWSFQGFCVISGMLLYFKGNTPQQRKRLLFGYVTAILMVFSIEIVLHLFAYVLKLDGKGPEIDKRLSLPSYRDADWAEAVFRDNNEMTGEFEQYLGFARKDYHSQYTNVDSEGARKTWNPANIDELRAKTIFMFGGSTMFGWFVRDDYTIASHASKLLNAKDGDYIVSNYGQAGYMFMQEIMKLALLLRQGERPDYVLLYDGVNDVYGAYQSGKAGTYQNILIMKEALNYVEPTPVQHFVLAVKGTIAGHSMIYRALRQLPSLFVEEPEFKEVAARYNAEQLKALAEDISNHYVQSMSLLEKLSEAYDFEYICFWQPVIYTEKNLFPEESDPYYNPRLKDKNLRAIYMNIIGLLEARQPANFYNIYDALADRTEQVYSDVYHLSERGNEMVAERIVDVFEERFPDQ